MEERTKTTDSPDVGGAANGLGKPDGAEDTVELSDSLEQLAALTAERDKLAAEKADIYDRLLRKQAEFDNYRRRAERERGEAVDFGRLEASEIFLPIVDDFERALKVESADKEYARGMELIYQRLQETLKKLGIEQIQSVGQKFDPNLHYAVDRAPREDVDEDTVIEEYQRGYQFRGKLVRPAMVKVASRP